MGKVRLKRRDVKIADEIIKDLIRYNMVDQSNMLSNEHRRAIYILQERGYIKDVRTHILQTDLTQFYFDDGGAKAIYKEGRMAAIEDKVKIIGIVIAAIAGLITICEAIVPIVRALW